MLNIAICDDDPLFVAQASNEIRRILQDNCVIHHISVFETGESLLCAGFFDIVFLDIEMNGANGIEIAETMRQQGNDCCIVFLTSHKKYVFSAFDVSASHYLLKPIDNEKLELVLMKLIHALRDNQEYCYHLKCGTQTRRLPFSQIKYAEIFGRKIILHTIQNLFTFNGRMDELERAFPNYFFRCHNSYLVNLAMVIKYDKESAKLQSGESVPIARRKYADFGTAFLAFLQQGEDDL